MAEKSGFFNAELLGDGITYDRSYLAESFASYFSKFIGNGVFINPATQLKVIQNTTPDMNVQVQIGSAFINGYWYENTATVLKTLTLAGTTTNRKDNIVLQWNVTTRDIIIKVKEGTPSGDVATAPTLERTDSVYELLLAVIDIPMGTSAITNSNITDKRVDETVCGFVKGVIDQISTADLFTQFETTFNTWFQTMKNQLSTDAAGNLQVQIDNKAPLEHTHTLVNGHTVESDVPLDAKFTDTVYEHPTTSGNKHLPAGGTLGQTVKNSADGTGQWGDMTKLVTGTLAAANWVNSSAPYIQQITVTGVAVNNTVLFDLGVNVTKTEMQAAYDGLLKATSQGVNTVTITALGEKPTIDIPVQFVII